ncbi:Hypp679 [Branchiostoma lanceolatum]|uniref:Hypp679 protein n=1 Tax=Branchiostoma lanceolatum TaxID=7740 RepID=A0A8J9VCN8_BRALA|nr:Hypp679 [Branchiostoma lanceolatum]
MGRRSQTSTSTVTVTVTVVRQGCVLAPTNYVLNTLRNKTSQIADQLAENEDPESVWLSTSPCPARDWVPYSRRVEKFPFIGSTISSDCKSTSDIKSRIGRSSSAMATLGYIRSNGYQGWLHRSATWTHSTSSHSLRRILDYCWYDYISNATVRQRSGHHLSPRKSGRLAYSSLAHSQDDCKLPASRRKPHSWTGPEAAETQAQVGKLSADLSTVDLDLATAWQRAQDRANWKTIWKAVISCNRKAGARTMS